MPVIQCERCGKGIHCYPCDVRYGLKKFCSKHCRAKSVAVTHGQSRSRLYNIWRQMKSRCTVKSHGGYKYYGGRGITVCHEWSESFEVFAQWANSNGYGETLAIDRIDPDGNYEPSNCRWATKQQQSRNTRKRSAASSRFKGVTWCPITKKWKVQIGINGNTKYVGVFVDEIEAAKAYDEVARRLFGEFAQPNFKS